MMGVEANRCVDVVDDVADHECVQFHKVTLLSGTVRPRAISCGNLRAGELSAMKSTTVQLRCRSVLRTDTGYMARQPVMPPNLTFERTPIGAAAVCNVSVYQIHQTDAFARALVDLRDVRAKARILARLDSTRLGTLGDTRSVGAGVSKMRIDDGGGYGVYFTRRRRIVIILPVVATSQRKPKTSFEPSYSLMQSNDVRPCVSS